MKTNELYLKTLFCCCACDGEIAQKEVDMIKELTENSTLFQEIQVEYSINAVSYTHLTLPTNSLV